MTSDANTIGTEIVERVPALSCSHCGSDEGVYVKGDNEWHWVRCANCGRNDA